MIEAIAVLALMIVGLLVMFRIIPLGKIPAWITGIILVTVLGPLAWSSIKIKTMELVADNYPWWVYILVVLVFLMGLRLILDLIFPRRR